MSQNIEQAEVTTKAQKNKKTGITFLVALLLLSHAYLLSNSSMVSAETNYDMQFSLGISDNDDKNKNGAPLLTLKFGEGTPGSDTVVAKLGTPTFDGVTGDPEWGEPSTIPLIPVLSGGGPTEATVRAAYDHIYVYFQVVWEDPTATESINKKTWTYDADTETWSQSGNEDRVYFLWDINTQDFEKGCNTFCHTEWEIDSHMGTNNPGDILDVWHWKAARTNPLGNADDKYWTSLENAKVFYYDSGTVERTRIADEGTGFDSGNKESGLPMYMNENDPGADNVFLFVDEAIPFDPDAGWSDDDTIPGYVLSEATGSESDVEAIGIYTDGVWVVEFRRALFTGNPDDVVFLPPSPVGLQGSQGVPGSEGAQGPQGESGEAGPQGAAGPQGEPSASGASGWSSYVSIGALAVSLVAIYLVYNRKQ